MKKIIFLGLSLLVSVGIFAQTDLTGDWKGECSCDGKEKTVLMAMHENGAFSIVIGRSDLVPNTGTWNLKRGTLTINTSGSTIKLKEGPKDTSNPVWTFNGANSARIFELVTPAEELPGWAKQIESLTISK